MPASDLPIDAHRGESLRERKKRRTSIELQHATLSLVLERGLANVTIDEISERAGVSARTFFNYFPSKEQAIVGFDPHHATWFAEALTSVPASEPLFAALRYVFARAAAAIADEADLHMMRMQVVRSNPELFRVVVGSFGSFERSVAKAISARLQHDDAVAYPDMFAPLAAGMCGVVLRTAMRIWCIDPDATSLAELFERGFAIVEAGCDPERMM